MKQNRIFGCLVAFAILCSCTEKSLDRDIAMSFNVDVAGPDGGATKAAMVGTLDAFKTAVSSFGVKVYYDNTAVSTAPDQATLSGSTYALNKMYYWSPGVTLDIYANAPASVTGLSGYAVSPSAASASFSYTIASSTAPSAMPDVMFARYKGTGNTGVAELKFHHALTAVSFVTGDLPEMKIKSISISGINSTGSCTASFAAASPFEPSFVWSSSSPVAYTCTLATPLTVTSTSGEQTINAGENTFIIIPQTVPDGAKLTVELEMASVTSSVSCSLAGKTWEPGTHYTYKIKYAEDAISFSSISVSPWTESDAGSLTVIQDS